MSTAFTQNELVAHLRQQIAVDVARVERENVVELQTRVRAREISSAYGVDDHAALIIERYERLMRASFDLSDLEESGKG